MLRRRFPSRKREMHLSLFAVHEASPQSARIPRVIARGRNRKVMQKCLLFFERKTKECVEHFIPKLFGNIDTLRDLFLLRIPIHTQTIYKIIIKNTIS